MRKLVLFSEQPTEKSHSLNQELLRLINQENPKIGYISSCTDPTREWFCKIQSKYENLGITDFSYFDVDEEFDENQAERLFSSDAIYLSGGNTFYFLAHLKHHGYMKLLKQFVNRGGVLIGVSAGSIIMTPKIDIASVDDMDENEIGLENKEGLGLVDFEFYPHWVLGSNLKEVLEYSKTYQNAIYVCSDEDGIVIEGSDVKLIGNVIGVKSGEVVD